MAERLEIIDTLESLAVHCRLPLLTVDERSRWMEDWCADLRPFPVEAIKTACARWRTGESAKFPTPGQLLPLVRAVAPHGQTQDRGANTPWAWPSDDELASMPLRERRRQHQIMANVCRTRAGPMDAQGNHARPEWIERSRNHAHEASRLATVIASYAGRQEEAA